MKPLSLITTLFAGTTAAAGISLGIWGMGRSNSDEKKLNNEEADYKLQMEKTSDDNQKVLQEKCKEQGFEVVNWEGILTCTSNSSTSLSNLTPTLSQFSSE